ncbi:MAG: hypothetical protein LBQ42_00270 [Synergistaceae bacterium]|jgi:hypothetical protein|nr:hypothetical protein [Synergistaceae bacterium]
MPTHIYRSAFKTEVLEAEGTDFQRLFGDLMRIYYPGFRNVRASAFKGDGGNDGWIETEGAYYQVYAPEINSINPEIYAVKKAKEDFKKLKENWDGLVPIRKFFFVFNNRMQPVSADLQKVMAAIKKENNLEEASVIDTYQILEMFDRLNEKYKIRFVGNLNDVPEALEKILSPLAELLKKLAQEDHDIVPYLNAPHPDFSVKIQFNGLSDELKARMDFASHYVGEIDNILSDSRGHAQKIVPALQELYQRSKGEISNEREDASDARYVWMMQELIPSEARGTSHYTSYRAAAEIIFAKYFESCDIYEPPGSFDAS